MTRTRAGTALLEVIAAVTILSIAVVAAVAMSAEAMRALERARAAEAEVIAASSFLDAVALWPREDLDRRLGARVQGPWRLYIERTLPTVYSIILIDTLSGRDLLRTALFRPEPENAQ